MPTIQSQGEIRMNTTNVRGTATLLNAEYGGITAFSLTGGKGSTEETGGYTRAVDIVSDEFDVRSGSIALLDTDPNFATMGAEATGAMLSGQRRYLWIAEAGTQGGQTPDAREYGPIEAIFSDSSLAVTVPNGGVWTLPYDVDGEVPQPAFTP